MTYKIDLPTRFNDCPIWWKDAIRKHGVNWIEDNGAIFSPKNMLNIRTVEFESEEHLTMLILKI
jgi:hypothetical protein